MPAASQALHLIACFWPTATEARVHLSPDSAAVTADAIAVVRVSHDRAPGYCADEVELESVEGDAAGVSEWLDAHAELVLWHWGRP